MHLAFTFYSVPLQNPSSAPADPELSSLENRAINSHPGDRSDGGAQMPARANRAFALTQTTPPKSAAAAAPPEDQAEKRVLRRTGLEPQVVGFDAQGREILDVPISNSSLAEPQVTGLPPVVIRDPAGEGEILEVVDDKNSQLMAAQYTGVEAQEIGSASGDTVLEVTSWPTIYEVKRTGSDSYEIYDPQSGTTILEAD